MPNIAQVMKEEIRRLAKKEAKALTGRLKADVIKLKRAGVAMRRLLKQLQRDGALLLNAEKRRQQNAQVIAPESVGKARITAKGIRAMRRKLRLSQMEFGKLVGVSVVAVGLWERKEGALRLRDATRAAILALRGVGAREARRRMGMLTSGKGKGRKTFRRVVKKAESRRK